MRRVGLVAGVCAFGLVACNALAAQTVEIGVKGGFLAAGMSRSDVSIAQMKALGMSSTLEATGGAFITLNLGPRFALQPEVLYLPKGGDWEAFGAAVHVKLTYVEVPLLAKLTFPIRGTAVRPHLLAGPALAFQSACDVTGQVAGFSTTMTCSAASGGLVGFKGTDAGMILGAGLDVPVGQLRAFVEGRADIGLSNVADSQAGAEIRNLAFAGYVGLARPSGGARADRAP